MSVLSDTWSETHPAIKTAIVVGGVLIVGYVGYKLVKTSVDFLKNVRDQAQEKQELENLADAGMTPTLSDSDINSMVSGIQTALSGWSEDEEAVKTQIRRVQNKADWLKLTTAWNVRDICSGIGSCSKYDLVGALQYYMPEEIPNINGDFSSRGINVQI